MKFTISFKTPDALSDAVEDVDEADRAAVEAVAGKFIEYGEYVNIEFDTKTGEAKVLPV